MHMLMWIVSRGGVLLIPLGHGYKVLIDLILHRSSINNRASLSNKFGGFYFIFKFGISGLLHQVVTTIADRIRGCQEGNDSCFIPTMVFETSVPNDTSGLVPQQQKASDYDNSGPVPQLQNVSPSADTTVPSQQELDLLFGPL
uniref:Uncharacterized protein n=1 Tax=Tanacetum cinerariifolium TaxID=118510 RepID=A0A699HUZ9_TANCI|nr:hypothetical protein [Tanacetum cinerariifolium]